MKVALYHPWIYLRSGVERMFVELVERSAHDWTLFTHRYEPAHTYPQLAAMDVRVLSPGVSVRRSAAPLGNAAAVIARTRLPDVGARALLVSSEGLGDLILVRNRLPAVAYCHTPLKIVHDPQTRRRLAEMDRRKHAAVGVIGPVFTAVDRILWRRYTHAFVNSNEVLHRLQTARMTPRGTTEVLHPGVDADRLAFVGGRLPWRFLVAGRIMWQKQIELAIDAIRILHDEGAPVFLDVAGSVDVKSEPYLRLLTDRARGLPITFHRDVDEATMVALMSKARALVFTAPNEDFGMVMLEAMSCGTPVIGVDRGGPREIVTPESGWLVDADARAFAQVIRRAAGESDGAFAARQRAARRRAEMFGWNPFVARLDDVVQAVAEGRIPS